MKKYDTWKTRIVSLISVCALALLFVAPGRAMAHTGDETQANRLYLEGQYSAAAAMFIDLYLETSDPVFLRNLARCYYQMKMPDQAIERFKEYLAKSRRAVAKDKEEVEQYIHEMEILRRQRGATAAAERSSSPTKDLASDFPTVVSGRAAGDGAVPGPVGSGDDAQERPTTLTPVVLGEAAGGGPAAALTKENVPGSGRAAFYKRAGVAAAIAGGVGLVGGIAFTVAWHDAKSSAESRYNASEDSAARTRGALAWIGYGLAAAGAAGVVTAKFLGRSEAARSLAVAPSIVGDAPGAFIAGTF
jgi:hypothetical protein